MKRRYFKITAEHIPPWSPFNNSYLFEEHVFAYSGKGAEDTFYRYHRNGFGHNNIKSIEEIPKEKFVMHHHEKIIT